MYIDDDLNLIVFFKRYRLGRWQALVGGKNITLVSKD